jgi:hypothetical protein
MDDKERELFEYWYIRLHGSVQKDLDVIPYFEGCSNFFAGNYKNSMVRDMWQAWKARAELIKNNEGE